MRNSWGQPACGVPRAGDVHTDQYAVYTGVIPAAQHKAITKQARKTNHIERFNNTLRQRVSRLVRDKMAFSKKLANHVGAIKYFICHYNLTKAEHYLYNTTGVWTARLKDAIGVPLGESAAQDRASDCPIR